MKKTALHHGGQGQRPAQFRPSCYHLPLLNHLCRKLLKLNIFNWFLWPLFLVLNILCKNGCLFLHWLSSMKLMFLGLNTASLLAAALTEGTPSTPQKMMGFVMVSTSFLEKEVTPLLSMVCSWNLHTKLLLVSCHASLSHASSLSHTPNLCSNTCPVSLYLQTLA